MRVHVQIVQGPAANQSFYVEKDSRITVGRCESADFQIEADELLSREHFAIEFDGNLITLADLGSTNGTFVDGQALTRQPVGLKDGQQFVAGRVSRFLVKCIGEPVKRADAKTTPSIAPLPQNPAAAPPSNPDTNFGSSIFSPGEVTPTPPAPSPAPTPVDSRSGDQGGGNFSQSIVTGLDDSGGPQQGSLLYSNPSTPSIQQPQRMPDPGLPPAPAQPAQHPPAQPPPATGSSELPPPVEVADAFGSIAAPGGGEYLEDLAPPLGNEMASEKDPTAVPMTPVLPPGLDPPPAHVDQAAANPAASPFASIQQPQPRPATPSPGEQAPPESPPQMPEVPTAPLESHSSSSIYTPGHVPQSPPSSQNIVAPDQPPTGQASPFASIGMPHQIPVAQPQKDFNVPVQSLPPGKVGFQVRTLANGLHCVNGTDPADVSQVIDLFNKKFEAIYCAHPFKAGLEEEEELFPPTAQAAPQETDDNASPFADGGVNEGGVDDGGVDDGSVPDGGDSPFEGVSLPAETIKETAPPKRVGIPLFDWFPKPVRWQNPILFTPSEFEYPIADIWQQDSLICLFGSSAKQIEEHCFKLLNMNLKTGKKSQGVFGFCWPSIMECTLESMLDVHVNRIFAGGVAAILIEDPQEEFGWCVYSRNDLSEIFDKAGFVRQN